MPRTLIIAVLAGAFSGAVFVAPMSESILGMVLINFTYMPLFLAGLGLGTAAVGIAALAGTVVVGAAQGLNPLFWFFAAVALPTALTVRQALQRRGDGDGTIEWYPPGRLLVFLVCYGGGMFILLYMIMASTGPGMIETTRGMLDDMFAQMISAMPNDKRFTEAGLWASYVPGALVVSWLITLVVNGALAQRLLKRTDRNIRPSLEFSRIELPLTFAFALVASAALWHFTDGAAELFGQTLTIIIALSYLFVGLAVIHQLSRDWPLRPLVLTLFYFVLLFFLDWPGLVLVTVVGLADQLFRLRPRFAGQVPDGENK